MYVFDDLLKHITRLSTTRPVYLKFKNSIIKFSFSISTFLIEQIEIIKSYHHRFH